MAASSQQLEVRITREQSCHPSNMFSYLMNQWLFVAERSMFDHAWLLWGKCIGFGKNKLWCLNWEFLRWVLSNTLGWEPSKNKPSLLLTCTHLALHQGQRWIKACSCCETTLMRTLLFACGQIVVLRMLLYQIQLRCVLSNAYLSLGTHPATIGTTKNRVVAWPICNENP